jgi:hypothetical protein
MHRSVEKIKEEYCKDNQIYIGNYPNMDMSQVTNDEVLLHANLQTANEVKQLRSDTNAYLGAIHNDVNIIKNVAIFWLVLTIILIGLSVFGIIRLSPLLVRY